jgi:HK97 gp10 family phage protein
MVPGWEREVEREARQSLVPRICDDIAQDARAIAPVDTGEMLSTIRSAGHEGRVYVGSDHWYYVEYGTSRMSAQPFMRPAAYTRRSY